MIVYLFCSVISFACFAGGLLGLKKGYGMGGRRRRKAVAEDALREMYGQYRAEVRTFAQRRMLDAPSDEEWLTGLRARAAVDRRQPLHAEQRLAEVRMREAAALRMTRRLANDSFPLPGLVCHPDGGMRTVAETQADEEEQRRQISRETTQGSLKHRRLPRWQHGIPKFVLFFDFILLLYFFAGITDVDWQSPLSVNLAFTTVLAAMVTVLTYGFLSFTGRRMRSYKNHAGTVHLDELDGFTKAAFGIAAAVITMLATLMYVRIHSEVLDALGPQAWMIALVIPLGAAAVSAVANYLVVPIHAFDGSDETARLDRLSGKARSGAGRRLWHRIQWLLRRENEDRKQRIKFIRYEEARRCSSMAAEMIVIGNKEPLPPREHHHRREQDRRDRGDDRNQDRVRADVDAADAGQYAVDQGKKRPGT